MPLTVLRAAKHQMQCCCWMLVSSPGLAQRSAWSGNSGPVISIIAAHQVFFKGKIYLFDLKEFERERQRIKGNLCLLLYSPDVCKSQIWAKPQPGIKLCWSLPPGQQGPNTCAFICCLSVSRKLVGKWRSCDTNWDAYGMLELQVTALSTVLQC